MNVNFRNTSKNRVKVALDAKTPNEIRFALDGQAWSSAELATLAEAQTALVKVSSGKHVDGRAQWANKGEMNGQTLAALIRG